MKTAETPMRMEPSIFAFRKRILTEQEVKIEMSPAQNFTDEDDAVLLYFFCNTPTLG